MTESILLTSQVIANPDAAQALFEFVVLDKPCSACASQEVKTVLDLDNDRAVEKSVCMFGNTPQFVIESPDGSSCARWA